MVTVIDEQRGEPASAQEPPVGLLASELDSPGEVFLRRSTGGEVEDRCARAHEGRTEKRVEVAEARRRRLGRLREEALKAVSISDVAHDAVHVMVDQRGGCHRPHNGLGGHQ